MFPPMTKRLSTPKEEGQQLFFSYERDVLVIFEHSNNTMFEMQQKPIIKANTERQGQSFRSGLSEIRSNYIRSLKKTVLPIVEKQKNSKLWLKQQYPE